MPLYCFLYIFRMSAEFKRIVFSIVLIATFWIPAKAFYIDFMSINFPTNEYIYEYSENEKSVIQWLLLNAAEGELVMNMGHHYILTASQTLPHNKYLISFPWLLLPLDQTTSEILSDPPPIVIIDHSQIDQFPILNDWPFLAYVYDNYLYVETYDSLSIWVLPERKHVIK